MRIEPVIDQRPGASVRSWLVFRAARMVLRPLLTHWPLTSWGILPLALVDTAAELLPPPRGARFERVTIAGCQAEWATTDDTAPDGAVLYFHGGAFVTCGLATHRPAAARIAAASGLPVLSVAYRQLPAVRLAGSVGDCFAGYRWLLERGIDPKRIVLAGDSAGGHLVFSTALAARAAGLPLPAGIVALSPWLDLDSTSKQSHPNAARDAYAPVGRLPALARLLTGAVETDPELSPVNQDLTGLPPVLIITAESEMLRCDAELMAQRLGAAGVPCVLQVWDGQVHAFPVLGNLIPESRAAITEIGGFIRQLVDTTPMSEPDEGGLSALAG